MALWGTERERKPRKKSAAPADAVQTTAEEYDGKQGIWAPVSLWTDRKTRAASGRNTPGEKRCVSCLYSYFSLYLWNPRIWKKNLFLLSLLWIISKSLSFPVSRLCICLHFWVQKRKLFSLRAFPSARASLLCTQHCVCCHLQVLIWSDVCSSLIKCWSLYFTSVQYSLIYSINIYSVPVLSWALLKVLRLHHEWSKKKKSSYLAYIVESEMTANKCNA